MRTWLLGFLLSPILLLAQSPISHTGEVTVGSLDVTSGSAVSSEHLFQITQEIESHSYPPSQLEEMAERARYLLQREGYFKADVSLNEVRTVSTMGGTIAATLAIKEGQQYRLEQITFSGNKEFSELQLRQQFLIADGDVFDTEQIRKGIDQIRRLYGSRGYINFTPVPNTEPDKDRDVIRLEIDCDEGKQFYFGKLVVAGRELHPGDGEKIVSAWKPYEGRVYNQGRSGGVLEGHRSVFADGMEDRATSGDTAERGEIYRHPWRNPSWSKPVMRLSLPKISSGKVFGLG